MSVDTWKGATGNWSVASNWSAGVPTSTSTVTVAQGDAVVTSPYTIASLTISAQVDYQGAGANAITGALTNSGFLNFDVGANGGGTNLTVGGAFTNTGVAQFGPSDGSLSSAELVKVATIANSYGALSVNGDQTSAVRFVFDVTSGAAGFGVAGNVVGDVTVTGDAVIEFASGQISTIASGASLTLIGASALIADAATNTTNSALSGLSLVAGDLDLENGVTLKTTGALTNINSIYFGTAAGTPATSVTVTGNFYNDGTTGIDSSIGGGTNTTITGALVNNESIYIGNNALSASTTVSAASVQNYGSIQLYAMRPAAALSLLKVGGAAGFGVAGHLMGSVQLSGDSEIQFATGQITTLDAGGYLDLVGPTARIALASVPTTNSALTGLTQIAGELSLQSGAVLKTNAGLTVNGYFYEDTSFHFNGQGGSNLTVAGTLTNNGDFRIGSGSLTGATQATVNAVSNQGDLAVYGSYYAAEKATLTVTTGAAGFGVAGVLSGSVNVGGDAAIVFASGQISTITGHLYLDGAMATVSDASSVTTNSALSGLATINGSLEIEDGAKITTTGPLIVNSSLQVDSQNSGGSTLAVTGALTNNGSVSVGNSSLSHVALVSASSITGSGSLYVTGGSVSIDGATLKLSGAAGFGAAGVLNNRVTLTGYAGVVFSSGGQIATIGSSGALLETGKYAVVADPSAATSNSALKGLTSNAGTLQLSGGAAIATTGNLANTGYIQLDYSSYSGVSGGSSLTVASALNNSGNIYAGSASLGATDTISVGSVVNSGHIVLTGAASAAQTVLSVGAAAGFGAAGQLTGNVDLGDYSSIQFASGSLTKIAANSELTLGGAHAYVEDGASNSDSALASLALIAGSLTTTNGKSLNLGATTVQGKLTVGSQSSVTSAGAVTNAGTVTVGGYNLLFPSTLNAASFVNTGSLTIQGGATATGAALVNVTGAAGFGAAGALTGEVTISGYGALEFGSGSITSISSGADVNLSGAFAVIENTATNANSALGALSKIAGLLVLHNGEKLTTSVALTVTGTFDLDTDYNDAGSTVRIGGALNNSGNVVVGNTYSLGATMLTVSSLSNSGNLTVAGIAGTAQSIVKVGSAAGFSSAGILTGNVTVQSGAIAFASGQITTIATGASLSLNNAQSFIEDGVTNTNSALTGLKTISGMLALHGGAKLTTSVALTNNNALDVDTSYNDGGSSVKVTGALTNNSDLYVGGYNLIGNASVTASSLINDEYIDLQGSNGYSGSLVVSGAVTNNGTVSINNDSEILAGAISGTGTGYFNLTGSSLEFDGAVDSHQHVNLYGTDTLTLKNATNFNATISYFAVGDLIDATTFGAGTTSSFSTATEILTLTSGANSAHLQFSGPYAATDFMVTSSAAGTMIKHA